MNILINQEPIDVTLEREENLGEVILALRSWLGEAGLRIRSIAADGDSLDESPEGWSDRKVSETERVEVIAVTPLELAAEKIESLHDYFTAIRDSNADSAELIRDLMEESQAVSELLTDAVSPEISSQFVEAVATHDGVVDWDSGTSAVAKVARRVIPILEERFDEINDPLKVLRATIPPIRESIGELAEVSAYLQNGEDSEAMRRVVRFLELAQQLIRLGDSLRQRQFVAADAIPAGTAAEMNGFLAELSSAIAAGDTITIGDLLEYEIGPRFYEILTIYERAEIPA